MADDHVTKPLTARQAAIYAFIREEILRNQRPPTLIEMCRRFGWKNRNASAAHLKAIERRGYITLSHGQFRGIKLTEDLSRTAIGAMDPVANPTRYEFGKLFEEPEHFVVVAAGAILWNNAAINAGDHCIMSRSKKPKIGDVVAVVGTDRAVGLQQHTKGLKIAGVLAGVIRVL